MYCENCGSQISDSSQKCEYCGKAVSPNQAMGNGPAGYPQDNSAQQGNYPPQQPPAEVYNPYGQYPVQGNYPPEQNNINSPQQNINFYNNTVPTPKPVKNSAIGAGIGSIVISIVCFFIFGWLSFAGLGLGITAITTARKSNSPAAGLVLGIIGTIANGICVILWFVGLFIL